MSDPAIYVLTEPEGNKAYFYKCGTSAQAQILEAAVPTEGKGKGKGKFRAECSSCGKEFYKIT
jgi:hypothetical protein